MQRRSFVAALCLPLAGCYTAEVGPEKNETQTIPMDDTEMLTAELKMSAGKLILSPGSGPLLEAKFRYNVEAWKPVVRYNPVGFRGHLTLEQPKNASVGGDMVNEWQLRFNEKKPLDLRLNLGAGEAKIDLGRATVRGIEINMGVGQLDLDLRGEPQKSYSVRINGGVGEAVVRLPSNVRIRARAHGGIGAIETTGLTKRGDMYSNEAPQSARSTINLEVRGGVGKIQLLAE